MPPSHGTRFPPLTECLNLIVTWPGACWVYSYPLASQALVNSSPNLLPPERAAALTAMNESAQTQDQDPNSSKIDDRKDSLAAVAEENKDHSAEEIEAARTVFECKDVEFYYGDFHALHEINMEIPEKKVTAFIGPSGCGKSTLLRCFNRMNDLVPSAHVRSGTVEIHGTNIYDQSVDVTELRKRVGMVFQKYNPFPKSIYENIVYGLRIQGVRDKNRLDEAVETSLKGAALWDEVKDRLKDNAFGLSGGQQQRLCIARTIAIKPEVILMDEPCAAQIGRAHV